MGWSGVTNGELLAKAADAAFDALVTMDVGFERHQRASLPVTLILVRAASTTLDDLKPLVPAVLKALESAAPRSFVVIPG